jgi:hypothetical protein
MKREEAERVVVNVAKKTKVMKIVKKVKKVKEIKMVKIKAMKNRGDRRIKEEGEWDKEEVMHTSEIMKLAVYSYVCPSDTAYI